MSQPIVTIKEGKLIGKTSKNLFGKKFYSFLGIPYAKPPLGDLRFKAPEPAEPWSKVRDATIEGNECFSRNSFLKNLIGSEDCLILNVYTQQLPAETNSLKPVMFWIHGGSFREGSSRAFGPEYLLTEDIVLVTINYRLGILGFLNFEDESLGVPGNAGLKDMVMALKWVKNNIVSFCGDPNNITIFGQSSGSCCVHYLVLSPLAKGLFHKAICQSNVALCSYARGKNVSKELATVLKLPVVNEKEILENLMKLPVEKVFEISEEVLKMGEDYNADAVERMSFAPVAEKPSEEAFITKDPLEVLNSGDYNKVPMIFGYNSGEAMYVEAYIKPRQPEMPKNFEKIIPYMLGIERGTETAKIIAKKIKNFYYGLPGAEKNINNFYKLHLDNFMLREVTCAINHHIATSSCPVYLYRMSIVTKLNLFKLLGQVNGPGPTHGDDIGYLFKTKMSPDLKPGSLEEKSVKRFVKMWTNFAKYGNPNDPDGEELWKTVKENEIHFLDIGEELVPGVNPEQKRIRFWKEIFSINPLYRL